ncbi:MAG: RNA polymerase sigma factor [Lachnospiraceae bacterium]|nr:RNA polymerase sigma factor [Lachnospiraceae bacterium]
MRRRDLDELISKAIMENYKKYYRLAYSYVRNAADAEDILQEAAVSAIRKSNTLKNPKQVETWLYRIVINRSIDFLRKYRYMESEEKLKNISTEDNYSDRDLQEIVERLKEPDRSIIKLRYYEELKLKEIADILGLSLSQVKSRLYRVLKRLSITLKEEFE